MLLNDLSHSDEENVIIFIAVSSGVSEHIVNTNSPPPNHY